MRPQQNGGDDGFVSIITIRYSSDRPCVPICPFYTLISRFAL